MWAFHLNIFILISQNLTIEPSIFKVRQVLYTYSAWKGLTLPVTSLFTTRFSIHIWQAYFLDEALSDDINMTYLIMPLTLTLWPQMTPPRTWCLINTFRFNKSPGNFDISIDIKVIAKLYHLLYCCIEKFDFFKPAGNLKNLFIPTLKPKKKTFEKVVVGVCHMIIGLQKLI